MKSEIPEIEAVCPTGYGERFLLTNGDKGSYADGHFADESYFDVFNLNILAGNGNNLFPDNQSIIICQKIARILFLVMLVFVLVTVSYQSFKAASQNPVIALKTE